MAPRPRNGLSLCAGGAGLDMGLMLAEPEFHTRCFVEWEEYPRSVIIAAQRAGYLAPAPIWDDLTTFDAKPLAGAIDTLLAGYPCQPFSAAGQRRGEDDERHLFPHVARVAEELGDSLNWIFLENVAGHVTLGAEAVLRTLRDMGFTPAAGLFSAEEIGAPQERLRWFCVAYRDGQHRRANGRQPDTGSNGRNIFAGRCGKLDHTPSARCDAAGQRAGAIIEGGQCLSGAGCDELADAKRNAGHERRYRNGRRAAGNAGETDCASTSRTPLFPPGPGDSAAWSAVLQADASAAPSLGRGGTVQASKRHITPLDSTDATTAAQLPSASLAGRREFSPVEKEAAELLGAEAVASIRRLTDGLAFRSRALRLLGNGVVPLCAAYAWRTLSAAHGLRSVDLGTADISTETNADGI